MTRGAERTRYRFGPLERRGLIAGWRGGQIASIAAGLVVAVLALRSRPNLPSVLVAIACVVGSVVLATWPIGGQTGEQWMPVVARWVLGGSTRRVSCVAPHGDLLEVRQISHAGKRARMRRRRVDGVPGPDPFAGLELLALDSTRGRLVFEQRQSSESFGVIRDRAGDTFTAVLAVRGHSFALLGDAEKERRIASWATVLSSMARQRAPIRRFQWLAGTDPDDGAALRDHVTDHARGAYESSERRSYEQLLALAGAGATRHHVLLAVQVGEKRLRRPSRNGVMSACALLRREVDALVRQLRDADVVVERVLGVNDLAECLLGAFASGQPRDLAPAPHGPRWPWPMGLHPEWSSVRVDGSWHATFWISEWPRVDVGPEFLGPLLLGSVRRTTSVVMEPVAPGRAVRQVETARTADLADAELRRRGGFLATARRAREADTVVQRESELAEGHASFRFSGYVTVRADSAEELEEACQATEQAAGQAHLELRRLYGDQLNAVALTLPLCRGLS